jgi:Flp pilus assembly protein TadG
MKFPLHHGRKPQRGAATIELIIVLPFLLLLLVGSTDYARVMHTAVSLDSAVRVGVLTGVYILNQPDGYTKDADGNITVSGDVYEAMQVAAVTEALPPYHSRAGGGSELPLPGV